MTPTFWIASYPKSGNTWFRLLLANLARDTPLAINDLRHDSGTASARPVFDEAIGFPSALLTHAECDRLRPRVYRALAARASVPRFVKTHDAWTRTDAGEPLMGGPDAAAGAILIVRDPRDVVASLAHHMDRDIDWTIAFMADPASAFCGRTDRQHHQLRQQLRGWSGFHDGWMTQDVLPVHIVRYEALHADAAATFAAALRFAGVDASSDAIARAVDFAGFDKVQAQERATGFGEAPPQLHHGGFFRRGIAGNWRDELSAAQAARVVAAHSATMARLGYGTGE
ncbi:sulfotransferase domain-containing protein [Sphingomonas sp. Leaf4]|uniref:sulfotransferase domain-containing protein n=1 Tax=Sphingomonas sp. Leaf4 TaxID=2876553 RepID=UPI001E5FA575|nr:sulfotransferase domain-containing protein [Sphingomonas sp. Leaf4]